MRDPLLPPDEGDEQRRGAEGEGDDLGRGPTPGMAPVQRDEEREETEKEEGGPGAVEGRPVGLRLVARDEPGAEEQGDRPDRNVDVEDGTPTDVLRQQASEGRSRGEAEIGHHGLQSESLPALLARKRAGEDRGGIGEEHRRGDRLHGARPDEPCHRGREPTQRRARDEPDEARHVHALVAAQVAEPPESEQQPAHDEQVDRHHPFDGGDVRRERGAKEGEDGVHHAAVEGGHESARADGGEDPPLAIDFAHRLRCGATLAGAAGRARPTTPRGGP